MKVAEEKHRVYPIHCTGCRPSNVAVDPESKKAVCNACGWKMKIVEGQPVDVLPNWTAAGTRKGLKQ
jgi:transcription initiation factor TFIIIB Brf1 subunit/transcription initiation factor TFIIB